LKGFIGDFPEYERLLPHVRGNIGFIFTNADLNATRAKILEEKKAAPARAGAVAPLDVYVPAGNTGMEPGKTSFFQALGVPTKIARGTIEITTDLKLVEAGGKVGASEATLLNMLNISPFTYGMSITQIYDQGQTFAPEVLDIEEKQLLKALSSCIATITAISLATNFPTLPSIMHSFMNGYKQLLSVAIESDYAWSDIEELKDRIANPDAYAAAAPAGGVATTEEAAPEATKEAEKEEEEEKEDSDEGGTQRISFPYHNDCSHLRQASVVSSTRCRMSNDTAMASNCRYNYGDHFRLEGYEAGATTINDNTAPNLLQQCGTSNFLTLFHATAQDSSFLTLISMKIIIATTKTLIFS